MVFHLTELVELSLFGSAIMVLALGSYLQGRHLQNVPRIVTSEDFDAFKRFARWQMYLTIVFLLATGPAIFLRVFWDDPYSFLESVVLWLPCAVIGLSSLYTKSLESDIRDPLRVAPEFANEFDDVCHVWRKKLLPDF